jgi:ABC-2 type transport system ATP-binding protein
VEASEQLPAIHVARLVRTFGPKTALAGVDLDVEAGEIHALLGPNGAGKTTLIRILAGLAGPDSGEVVTSGTVGFVPSGDRTFYLRISGLENLIFFARLHGLRLREARRRAHKLLADVGLAEAARLPVGRYSHGMQKRLSVARALLPMPAVLLVDEATHDLDPQGAVTVRELVRDLAVRGAAIIWTTQRIEEVRDFADRVTFLRNGSVSFRGSVAELIARAPEQRFVVAIRNGHPDRPPDAARLREVLSGIADVTATRNDAGHFLLAPCGDRSLGAAFAALAAGGYDVLNCRPERAEIEEAFIALASEGSG